MSVTARETKPVEVQPLKLDLGSKTEDEIKRTSAKILESISKYRLTKNKALDKWVEGIPKFLQVIEGYLRTQDTLRMCLPAFPFKSANKIEKVLGNLPDRAEEIALARLNTMCAEIGEIYKPGAKLLIISDGLVYNDLLTIPDREVWAYGEELRALATKTSCKHIKFSRLNDLVSIKLPEKLREISYVANATNYRRALLDQFGDDHLDVDMEIAKKGDTCLTYCGYTRFLENDLKYIFPRGSGHQYRRDVKFLAKEMIKRGFAFAAAVKKNFPDHLRLSIHQSTGEHKISISLLPTSTMYTTPWHCSVAYRADGSLTSGTMAEFKTNPRFEVVCVDGRPSFFKGKNDAVTGEEKELYRHKSLSEVGEVLLEKKQAIVVTISALAD